MRELDTAASNGTHSNSELLDRIKLTIDFAATYTKMILKEEWQRLKSEVANPNRLLLSASDR